MKASLVAFVLLFSVVAGADITLHFVVKAPWNTPTHDSVYISGIGSEPVALKLRDHLTYVGAISVADSVSQVSFKITRGSEQNQAVDQNGIGLGVFSYGVKNIPQPFVFSVVNWKDLPALGTIGNIKVFSNVYSPQLQNSRNVSVWLPPGYENRPQDKYPVIYMHDGQNVFNPKTSTTGVDWRVDDILNFQVASGLIRPAIVVAVDCTKDHRFDEYDYTRTGSAYANFLIQTVKPMIDQNFRTEPSRNSTFTMGSSMGALISLSLIWKHPEVFSKAAGLSLAAGINNWSIVNVINSSPYPKAGIQYYFDNGLYNDDAQFGKDDEVLARFLLTKGFNQFNFAYDVDPYGDHREVDWARRVAQPLQWLLKK